MGRERGRVLWTVSCYQAHNYRAIGRRSLSCYWAQTVVLSGARNDKQSRKYKEFSNPLTV